MSKKLKKEPLPLTDEMNRVCEAYEKVNDLRSAALQCDISPAEVSDWIEANSTFRYKIDLIAAKKTAKRNVWEGDETLTDQQRAYLAAFAVSGRVGHSAEVAGTTVQSVCRWRTTGQNPEHFNAAEALAREMAIQSLEDEAARRATVGESDRLLEFMLKGNKPDRYANAGGEAQHQFIKVVGLPQDAADKLAKEVAAISKENK